jgi:hypothetical protein
MVERMNVQHDAGWETTVLQRRLYTVKVFGVEAYRKAFPDSAPVPDGTVAVVLSLDETGEREPMLRFISPDCIHEVKAAVRMSSP